MKAKVLCNFVLNDDLLVLRRKLGLIRKKWLLLIHFTWELVVKRNFKHLSKSFFNILTWQYGSAKNGYYKKCAALNYKKIAQSINFGQFIQFRIQFAALALFNLNFICVSFKIVYAYNSFADIKGSNSRHDSFYLEHRLIVIICFSLKYLFQFFYCFFFSINFRKEFNELQSGNHTGARFWSSVLFFGLRLNLLKIIKLLC